MTLSYSFHHYMNYLQFLFCQYIFFVINFNLSVNLSTFKNLNPHTWKSLCFTNFNFLPWVKSYSLVFILLFNDTLMKSLFVNLVTKRCEDIIYNHLKQLYSTYKVNTYSFFVYIRHWESQNNALKPQLPCFISSKGPFLFIFLFFFPFKIKVFW